MNDIQKAVNYILSFDEFFEEQEQLGLVIDKSSSISAEARKKGNDLYTQESHNQNIHKAILFQYTKSIAFAPRDAEELPLAYSNRSALLLHLKHYKESLIDAQHALQFTKSEALKAKLEARQKKCAEALGGEPVNVIVSGLFKNLYAGGEIELDCTEEWINTDLKLPDIKTSSTLPCASKFVKINYNETFGRHLIATENIQPGEVILIEKGYVCYPKNSQLYLVCSHCLQFLWNVISCVHCPYAVYCSEACRYEAWQEYHDEECRILPYLYYKKDADITDVRAIARMLIKVLKNEGLDAVLDQAKATYDANGEDFGGLLLDGTLDSSRFWSCYHLACNSEESRKNESTDYFYESLIVSLLYRLTDLVANESNVESMNIAYEDQYYKVNGFDGKILIQLRDILIRLRDVLDINSQGYQAYLCSCPTIDICSKQCDSKRGIMISPCNSLLNHSCIPNVNNMFLPKGKIVMFTTAAIKKGEQIFASYGPVFTTERDIRQAHLKSAFHFTCECTPCKENWSCTSDLELYPDPRVGAVFELKNLSQIQKSFSDEEISFYFNEAVDQWKFDKKTLKYAKEWIKQIYTHFDKREAFIQSLPFKVYIDTAFYKLYGEQCIIPNDC